VPNLAAKLCYRNYTEGDYAAALEELAARGWIMSEDAEHYFVQKQAAHMRQQVEETTDRLFEAAFADLTTIETEELKQLMNDFCRQIRASTLQSQRSLAMNV
jgi:hypothetical protein